MSFARGTLLVSGRPFLYVGNRPAKKGSSHEGGGKVLSVFGFRFEQGEDFRGGSLGYYEPQSF